MKEVFIHHVVGSSLTSEYREEFWTTYTHLDTFATGISAGANVSYWTDLGEVGHTGGPACTTPTDHLHFSVLRVRNVTGALMHVPNLPVEEQTSKRFVDPFGWTHPSSVDPWAFHAPPGWGAASINLWIPALPADWSGWSAHTH